MRVQVTACLLAIATLAVAQSLVTSTSGSCAGNTGETCLGSKWGDCCSPRGFCGNDTNYCGAGCQSGFGSCYVNSNLISVDGSCGTNGTVCLGSIFGNCCSKTGFCGNTTSYCGTGCQAAYGGCGDAASTARISTTIAPASTASARATTLSSSLSSSGVSSSSTTGVSSSQASSSSATSSSSVAASSVAQSQSVTSSTGFKAGIAIAAVVLVALLGALVWFFFIRRSRQPHTTSSEPVNVPHEYPKDIKYPPRPAKVELEGTTTSVSEVGGNNYAELPGSHSYRP